MLDLAKVTAEDYVIDLGSGDGRMVIAAAKRGARALGVEFNPEMVKLAQQRASEAGVATAPLSSKGDMFEADISKATVLALFLMPENLRRLEPKFLALPAGTRSSSTRSALPTGRRRRPKPRGGLQELVHGDALPRAAPRRLTTRFSVLAAFQPALNCKETNRMRAPLRALRTA